MLEKPLKLPSGCGFFFFCYIITQAKLIKTNFGQNKFVSGQTINMLSLITRGNSIEMHVSMGILDN